MDKLPVGQLPDLKQSNNDDEIMVITDSEHNQLKKEKISDFITDLTSTDENNAIVKGTDGKMFVTDFGNASNITEGTLPTSVLPEIPLEKLPVSGVSADTYAYPSSVTVNSQGQVTAIEAGEPGANNANQDLSNISEAGKEVIRETAGSDYHLTQNQITNCILEAPNGVATYSGTTITVKQGLKGLSASGNNPDGTINNASVSIDNDISQDISTFGNMRHKLMIMANKGENNWSVGGRVLGLQWFEQETQPEGTEWTWYNTKTREWKNSNNGVITDVNIIPLGIFNKTNSDITEFYIDQPVELVKRSDAQIQAPYITETYENGTSWYRVWSDGWCEQGGKHISSTSGGSTLTATISLLKQYKDVNYGVLLTNLRLVDWAYSSLYSTTFKIDSTKVFTVQCVAVNNQQYIDGFYWHTIGYIS